ncbi:organic hydroperoxide resistance protein [Marinibacterium profundimaris]|uniref:Organic hydroperoxide resistance protein n=1 Tax=Marinibacterium profundimaris TaxID=1679460 RepID=A0A225NIM4_9RHOB|nr:organic hydroperoxide resistance protein [Marinibacterium profundimaris]OWU73666.1 organic hydroperoxide resistance protein [Marinibacterium profundimaris]
MANDPLYSTTATVTGGREGKASVSNGNLDLTLTPPKEMGGSGTGTNPEQLFAVGYAACFMSAMKMMASKDDSLSNVPDDATIDSTVSMGKRDDGGFKLKIDFVLKMPGLDAAEIDKIAEAGHSVCPYTHAVKGNIDVTTTAG